MKAKFSFWLTLATVAMMSLVSCGKDETPKLENEGDKNYSISFLDYQGEFTSQIDAWISSGEDASGFFYLCRTDDAATPLDNNGWTLQAPDGVHVTYINTSVMARKAVRKYSYRIEQEGSYKVLAMGPNDEVINQVDITATKVNTKLQIYNETSPLEITDSKKKVSGSFDVYYYAGKVAHPESYNDTWAIEASEGLTIASSQEDGDHRKFNFSATQPGDYVVTAYIKGSNQKYSKTITVLDGRSVAASGDPRNISIEYTGADAYAQDKQEIKFKITYFDGTNACLAGWNIKTSRGVTITSRKVIKDDKAIEYTALLRGYGKHTIMAETYDCFAKVYDSTKSASLEIELKR